MFAQSGTHALDDERRSWMLQQRALLQRHGRVMTLAIALRHVRNAPSQKALLGTIEEILVQHVGVSAFEIVDTHSDTPRVLTSRGISSADASAAPLARIPLGAGTCSLGTLLIHRLVPTKRGLDDFDQDLLAALAPQIAIALHMVRGLATRPTVRPPSGDAGAR